MDFTALHRALGRQPGPLTDDMLDDAVAQGVAETDDLDWKAELPPEKQLAQSDTVKDIAAMANSGGGVIVFGIKEIDKSATGRVDAGIVSEGYESTLRKVAVSGIHPPVFGIGLHALGEKGRRAFVVVVPASVDVPHMIYRGEYFGAPIRNDADTVWMRERQLETLYRARLDDRRAGHSALTQLHDEALAGRDTKQRAWLVGVARPRVLAGWHRRLTREEARGIYDRAGSLALVFAGHGGVHPLESVDRQNPRPGLRRWVAANNATSASTLWKESWSSVLNDGSVTLACAIGGQRTQGGQLDGNRIDSASLECCIADLLALVRETSGLLGTGDYEVRVAIEWAGEGALVIQTVDGSNYPYDGGSIPLSSFTPVEASIRTDLDSGGFFEQVFDLALDAVNQGGVQYLRLITSRD